MLHVMRRMPFVLVVGTCLSVLAALFSACGSDTKVDVDAGVDASGDDGSVVTPETDGAVVEDGGACKELDQACTNASECCSQKCESTDGGPSVCVANCTGAGCGCSAAGEPCTEATANVCCTLRCGADDKCSDQQCVADNGACAADADCCGKKCTNNVCVPLNGACKTEGNACTTGADCCSKQCAGGLCINASFCGQNGDICAQDGECCGGNCVIGAGATFGTCAVVAGPGSGCNPDGTLCTGTGCDNKCCSSACGPYGTTGVKVCQPASGCRPEYGICGQSSDCCGAAPNPPLTATNVTCSKGAGETLGRCEKAGVCDPPGGICKIAACGEDNRCCPPVGQVQSFCSSNPENCCKYDALGIPRCILAVRPCDANQDYSGEQCASSADCCGAPCVGNVCGGKSTTTCVAQGGTCTTSADCCKGLPCTVAPGAATGTCGAPPDAGTGGPANCALYGQDCTAASDCCNGVPCTTGKCRYP